MSEVSLAQDLADALEGDKIPGVIIYDPAVGPPADVGPRGVGRVFLPAVDDLDEGGDE